MNRRTFLKSLTATCGAVVVCPGELLKSPVQQTSHIYALNYPFSGVTNAQLCELVRMALKDLPPMMFEDAFTKMDYTLIKNSKGEYYPGPWVSA